MAINLGQPVNWQSCLNRGLKYWGMSLKSGSRFAQMIDLCGRTNLPLLSTPTWDGAGHFPDSMPLRSDSAGERAEITTPEYLKLSFPLTLSVWVRSLGSATDYAAIFGCAHNNTDSTPYLCWSIGLGTSGAMRVLWNNAGYLDLFTGSTSYTAMTTWTHLALVMGLTSQSYYVNGVLDGSASATITAPTYDSTSVLCFGSYTGITSRNTNMQVNDGRIYDRALTVDEVRALRSEGLRGYPTMLNRKRNSFISTPPAAGSFKSAWARNSNIILMPGVLT